MEKYISIHALREESDDYKNNRCICAVAFQSTPSARRATGFYCTAVVLYAISIHALREESDEGWHYIEATAKLISIHALREESD